MPVDVTLDDILVALRLRPRWFGFLLGSGCSAGAGVPTAGEIVKEITDVPESPGLDPASLRRSYKDALIRLSRNNIALEQAFLRKQAANRRAGAAHMELATLVERRWVTAIFTTNFDGLAEKALAGPDAKRRARVVGNVQDAQAILGAGGIDPESDESYVIWLHGDYLMWGSRDQPWRNWRLPNDLDGSYPRLFRDWLHRRGLIVVGYGRGDDSVLYELEEEATHGGLPFGLTVVVRRQDPIPDWVDKIESCRQPAPWVQILRVESAEELFAKLRAALPGDLPMEWERVRQRVVTHSTNELSFLQSSGVYNPTLYQARTRAEETFQAFLGSETSRALLYVDRAGAGKTVLLSHLSDLVAQRGGFPIYYRAARWEGPKQFRDTLRRLLLTPKDVSLDDRLASLNRNLDDESAELRQFLDNQLLELNEILDLVNSHRYAVIFVDGANEASEPARLVQELTELISMIEGMRCIRVVVSCREETWTRYQWAPKQYWTAPGDTKPDAHAVRLGQFTDQQLADMWEAYAAHYGVKQSRIEQLPRLAKELVSRNALMLRLVAQAFGQAEVPQQLSSLQVFRRFFELFVEGDPPIASEPTTRGERKLLELLLNQLAQLDEITVHRQAVVDGLQEEVERAGLPWARPGEQGADKSPYATLLAKGVLEEVQRDVPGEIGPQRYVGFAFDRLFEFCLTQRLVKNGFQAEPEKLEELVRRGSDYASLWGAARTLVIQQIETLTYEASEAGGRVRRPTAQQEIAEWLGGWLQEKRTGLRGLVTDALVQLGEEDPRLVQEICLGLLREGGLTGAHVAAAVAVQRKDGDTLLAGCGLSDRQSRLRAAQGMVYLWQQDPERTAPAMRALGKLAEEEVGRATRVSTLMQKVGRVVLTAARSQPLARIVDDIDAEAPHLVAFAHLASELMALSRGQADERKAAQEALRGIVEAARSSSVPFFGRTFDRMFKIVATQFGIQAFAAGVPIDVMQLEIDELRRRPELREACVQLASTLDDEKARPDLDTLEGWARQASKGSLLCSLAIRGALISGLRIDPTGMVRVALALAESGNARDAWHGIKAAGYMVAGAIMLGAAEMRPRPVWLMDLAKGVQDTARRRFAEPMEQAVDILGLRCSLLDAEHAFLACAATGGDLQGFLEELLTSVPVGLRAERERAMIGDLALLTRLGYAGQAVEALGRWQGGTEPGVLDALSSVYAEILAAHPSYLEGKLEAARNQALETMVMKKLIEVSPERLLHQYAKHGYVAGLCHPRSAKGFAEVGKEEYQRARNPEQVFRIVCDFLFDLDETPFYYV